MWSLVFHLGQKLRSMQFFFHFDVKKSLKKSFHFSSHGWTYFYFNGYLMYQNYNNMHITVTGWVLTVHQILCRTLYVWGPICRIGQESSLDLRLWLSDIQGCQVLLRDRSQLIFEIPMTVLNIGLPKWLSGKEWACQCRRCRRCRFDPWVGKILWRRKFVFLKI